MSLMTTFVLALALGAPAADAPLLDCLPAQVDIAVWWRANPERAFLLPHLEHAWQRAGDAGVGDGLMELIAEFGGPSVRMGLEGGLALGASLLGGIDAANLLNEGAAALCVASKPRGAVLVLRPRDAGRALSDLTRLVRMLAGLTGRAGGLQERDRGFVLAMPELPGRELRVEQVGETLVAAFGRGMFDGVAGRIEGREDSPSFRDHPAWRRVSALLPRAEDCAYFVDLGALLALADEAVTAFDPVWAGPEAEPLAGMLKDLWLGAGLGRLLECTAGVSWTEGRTLRSSSVTVFGPHWRDTVPGRVLEGSVPERVPFNRVPGGATAMTFQVAMDAAPLMVLLREAFGRRFGAEALALVDTTLQEYVGVSMDDVLGLATGTELQYMVRSAKPTLLGQVDQSVSITRLRDPARAAAALAAIEKAVDGALRAYAGGMLQLGEVGDLPGFKSLGSSGLPLGSLAWGIREGEFYFSSDVDVLRQVLAGEHAGAQPFLWREDFARLGVIPEGTVHAFTYTDMGRLITNLAQVLNMAAVGAAAVPPDIPDAQKLRKVLAFIPRLSAPVRSLAFFGGMATATSFDARNGILSVTEAIEVPDISASAAPEAPAPRAAPPARMDRF